MKQKLSDPEVKSLYWEPISTPSLRQHAHCLEKLKSLKPSLVDHLSEAGLEYVCVSHLPPEYPRVGVTTTNWSEGTNGAIRNERGLPYPTLCVTLTNRELQRLKYKKESYEKIPPTELLTRGARDHINSIKSKSLGWNVERKHGSQTSFTVCQFVGSHSTQFRGRKGRGRALAWHPVRTLSRFAVIFLPVGKPSAELFMTISLSQTSTHIGGMG